GAARGLGPPASPLMTTRCRDDYRRARRDALVYRVVGRCVARVQRDEYVGAPDLHVTRKTRLETQTLEARAPRDFVAKLDELRPCLDACYFGAHPERVVQVVVD